MATLGRFDVKIVKREGGFDFCRDCDESSDGDGKLRNISKMGFLKIARQATVFGDRSRFRGSYIIDESSGLIRNK